MAIKYRRYVVLDHGQGALGLQKVEVAISTQVKKGFIGDALMLNVN